MHRRTKIVTTLGPATDRDGTLEQLIRAGADVVRLNFSHGSAEEHRRRAEQVREVARSLNTHVAILGDLQGPKVRISTFRAGAVQLPAGGEFVLDSALEAGAGDGGQVGLDYKQLPKDLVAGDTLLLDDGRIRLTVTQIDGTRVHTRVVVGGRLSNNKGINKLGGGLSAAALTDKDRRDIRLAAGIGVDYLAVSFPRSSADLELARELMDNAGLEARLVAKVERAEAVATPETMDALIQASDGVMVARGDLGVEIGDAALMGVQKRLIRRARQLNRVVITATQMMESMVKAPLPTRAEVMDVANAVLDGTDAVMLSGETAAGDYPVETVSAMAEVCLGAQQHPSVNVSRHRMDRTFTDITETVAMATMYAANHMAGVKAIVALTESGTTPLLLSRISSGLPIFACSRHHATLNRVTLFRGVYPVPFDCTRGDIREIAAKALAILKGRGELGTGDRVLLTHGDRFTAEGGTNSCKVLVVA